MKLTQTPVEFIFDRTTILKLKEKKSSKKKIHRSSCFSNWVLYQNS